MYTPKQQEELTKKYNSEMSVIKLRGEIILNPNNPFGYVEPNVEVRALQLRKIIEQIVLCSLITNSEKYLEVYNKLGKVWNAKKICNDIKELNPDYLPVAAEGYSSKDDPSEGIIVNISDNTLTESELLSIHERMGHLLHAKNPFSTEIDYISLLEFIQSSYLKIAKYLNTHTIKLYGGNDVLYVVMNSKNHDGRVVSNWFSRVQKNEISIQNPTISD